ncbi:MAG: hypothetical protein J6C10_05340 [Prevotella sp.]|nr:hypothetical protein [Prevotella sp.]
MKKKIYTAPEITIYNTIPGNNILAGSLPKSDEEQDIIDNETEILSKPVAPPNVNLWGDENEEEW